MKFYLAMATLAGAYWSAILMAMAIIAGVPVGMFWYGVSTIVFGVTTGWLIKER